MIQMEEKWNLRTDNGRGKGKKKQLFRVWRVGTEEE